MTDSAVSHTDELHQRCFRGDAALARAFGVLGKRWSGLVIGSLSLGPTGFRELARSVGGVSDSVLSDRLAELCELGLVARDVEPGPPVTVTYSLTEVGTGLLPALGLIADWADKYLPEAPC
ncbi:transcriptional regulator [Asanoa ishikariensis]|uniref:Transcriptional regulator, HxlR family n=1 Tax=Asanoa ishikariensis TaxID=137265 RepID=A0A1H3PFJ5_9ACTN|nr:helix-turn-helix domain-containing protein [Asanoa ishikariensis]GIF67843.1 transcriptional regulator [Asanoa ishikariensis]SDY99851.1 transcriptional regulator, HxlR family [Asanoa ishikariensis]